MSLIEQLGKKGELKDAWIKGSGNVYDVFSLIRNHGEATTGIRAINITDDSWIDISDDKWYYSRPKW